jgi:isocitrate lyase
MKNQVAVNHAEVKKRPESPHGHASRRLIATEEIRALQEHWRSDPRWRGVTRSYSAEKVLRLRGTVKIEHTIADRMSRKLWRLVNTGPYVNALGAVTGNQAVQMVQAGLKAIYLSGWQVAADNNGSASMYPDQSLYPSNSVPLVVRRINKALQRADQIQLLHGEDTFDMWAPIVADAEAGFGGALNAYELMLQIRRRGRALRGSTGFSQEMRPYGRQSARADIRVHPQADRRAPGR